MPGRHLHFVGSLPQFGTAAEAFDRQVGERLLRLTGGETGPRLQWFVPLVKELAQNPKINTLRAGDWTAYDDVDRLAVRPGERLTAADIPLRLAEYATAELAELSGRNPAGLPLQVGVPGYLDLAGFIFGPRGTLKYRSVFLEALAAQIAALPADRVVFQLEVPAALIAVVSAPALLRPRVARLMARLVTRQVALAPAGTRFGVHLCLGDLGHQPRVRLRSAKPVVQLADAVLRAWPADRPPEYLHLPMSGGDEPPSTDPRFYRPLRGLRTDVPIVAGIAHEEQPPDDQLRVRGLVEDALGRTVDISTSCGLGRRTPEQAQRATESMIRLL